MYSLLFKVAHGVQIKDFLSGTSGWLMQVILHEGLVMCLDDSHITQATAIP